MDKAKEVEEWIQYAQDDLDTAILLLEQYKKSLNILCFHCQQSAEKFLNAYLVSRNITFEKTHDLMFLLNCCKSVDSKFSSKQPPPEVVAFVQPYKGLLYLIT